jgi:hypothetical protein
VSGRTPIRVVVADAVIRGIRRGCVVANTAAVAVALGLMDRRHLHALDHRHYRRVAGSYASTDHNLRGLFGWEQEAVQRWFADCRSVVVVGAGAGREVLALAGTGMDVVGYECNERLMETGQAFLEGQGCTAVLRPLERDAAPPPGRAYDGLIVGWSAYMLMPGRAARVRFLRGMATIGLPDAPILLSFFTRWEGDRRLRMIARLAGGLRRLRRADPVELGDDLDPNYVHRFTEDEIRGELRDAGFELIRFTPQGGGPYDSGWAVGRLRRDDPSDT